MNKLVLPSFFLLALISVVYLSDSFSDKSRHFYGIAGQREQTISFQYPVEIIHIFGVEGKEVTQGEVILEVKQHELENSLATLEQEIKRIKLQKLEANDAISSQLASLEAKKQAVTADMDYQIHILELRLKINSSMLNSINEGHAKSVKSNSEINDLKRKRYFLLQSIQAEIDHLKVQKNSTMRPIDAQLYELKQRKEVLQKQNINLTVNAKFDGRIGSINFKTGELAPPFQSILSLHSLTPRYVKGYIHENIINDVKIGQSVTVRSVAFSKEEKIIKGVVESMGNRIIEYPDRLKKDPLVPAWGREVVVRLDDLNHTLLFGEKVEVLLEKQTQSLEKPLSVSHTNKTIDSALNNTTPTPIISSNIEIDAANIEASGILWQTNEANYLLISDESYNDHPGLFVMNKQGEVTQQFLLENSDRNLIDDIESISSDNGYIYLLSSLSHNKKSKLKKKRRKLIRFKYINHNVTEQQEIDIYQQLKRIIKKQPNSKISLLLNRAIKDKSLDIESHFVTKNNLYLGLKSPLTDQNEAIILKINDISALFEEKTPEAEIWKTVALKDPDTGNPMKLSDMTQVANQLFLLSVSASPQKKSVLWRYQINSESLKEIETFHFLRAEGITYIPHNSSFTVVFDEDGSSYSKQQSIYFPVFSSSDEK